MEVLEQTSTGGDKNAIIFFSFAYEPAPSPRVMTEARDAAFYCVHSNILDLSEAANCITVRLAESVGEELRGLAIVPELNEFLGYSSFEPGYALEMGNIYVVAIQQARSALHSQELIEGPPLRVMMLLPKGHHRH